MCQTTAGPLPSLLRKSCTPGKQQALSCLKARQALCWSASHLRGREYSDEPEPVTQMYQQRLPFPFLAELMYQTAYFTLLHAKTPIGPCYCIVTRPVLPYYTLPLASEQSQHA